MNSKANSEMNNIYQHLWSAHGEGVYASLDQSLEPRPPTMLYDVAKRLGFNENHVVLDVGCGRGNHVCEIAVRFGSQVVGIDLVASILAQGRIIATEAGVADQVILQEGDITAIPFEDNAFDFIWCRDMLVHVADLTTGLMECARVLRLEGTMLIFNTFATPLMEPNETAEICEPIGVISQNLSGERFEEIVTTVGFQIVSKENIGGELIEYYEEQHGRYSKELLRLARMIRAKDKFVAELGPKRYKITLALYRWGIYLLLGKLNSAIYVLKKQ